MLTMARAKTNIIRILRRRFYEKRREKSRYVSSDLGSRNRHIFAVCAVAATIIAFVIGNMAILLCDIPFLLIFVAAYLCWKNQKIRILDDLTFEYSTMFGNRKTYAFSQITQVKQNPDSYTVFADGDKIHIEACAVLSERLADKLKSY